MPKDRNYYRSMENNELLQEVKYATNADWQELALVLAERLQQEERKYYSSDDEYY